jgi:pyruvate dehydrogenase E1 component beta subunit
MTILTSVKKTNRLVVLEEAWPFASVASELLILFKNVLLIFLMHQFKELQLLTPSALFSSLVERMVA